MSETIGVRDFKDSLSAVLQKVREGATILVTDRGVPVVMLLPAAMAGSPALLQRAAAADGISWRGGKPLGLDDPPGIRGPSVSDAVIEDRRWPCISTAARW